VFNLPIFKNRNTFLRGENVYMRAPHRRDQHQWMDIRRLSREFLQPWEPTWPEDGAAKTAFRRRLRRFKQDWEDGTSYPFFYFPSFNRRSRGRHYVVKLASRCYAGWDDWILDGVTLCSAGTYGGSGLSNLGLSV
jgi:hypothetical protein